MTAQKTAWLGVLGVVLFVLTTIIGACLNNQYNSASQLISELYAINAKNAIFLRYFGYIPSGLFLAFFCFFSIQFFPKKILITIGLLGIGIFYGLGTVVCSVFPLDDIMQVKPEQPTISEVLHELIGLITYLLTPIALLLLGIGVYNDSPKYVSIIAIIAGIVSLILVMVFLSNIHSANIGIIQKVIPTTKPFMNMAIMAI